MPIQILLSLIYDPELYIKTKHAFFKLLNTIVIAYLPLINSRRQYLSSTQQHKLSANVDEKSKYVCINLKKLLGI